MTLQLDTDILVNFLKRRPEAVRVVESLRDEVLFVSVMTYGEVYEGVYFGVEPERHAERFEALLQGMTVLPLDKQELRRFARLRGELRRQGLLIPDADLLIAATAIHHGLTLVTRNRRHFDRVPGLVLYPP